MDIRHQLDDLAVLARTLLQSMLDERTGLFAHKAVWTPSGPRPVGRNFLYSAMTAIGLLHDRPDGDSSCLRVDATLSALHKAALQRSCPTSVLAATIWALAVAGDDRASSLLRTVESRLDVRASSTMELGLVLSGLAASTAAFPELKGYATPVADTAMRAVLRRFSNSAQLLHGTSLDYRPQRQLQRNVTSFASQVYAMHGLAEYARVTETSPPEQLQRIADRLVKLQGEHGQWCWIYSSRSGNALDRYPVYSVHQHGMAFMALVPIENLRIGEYRRPLGSGLAWVFGENELRTPLVDFNRRFISRSIQRSEGNADEVWGMSRRQRATVLAASWGLQKAPGEVAALSELAVLDECRPYELGWLLYARSLIRDADGPMHQPPGNSFPDDQTNDR